MYEEAQKIIEYLPIRQSQIENDYIDHLLNSFLELEKSENSARSFVMMPFHLLFMLVIQYKTIRIAQRYPESTALFFAGVGGREKNKLIDVNRSVFDIACINERTIPEIFRLIKLEDHKIKEVKDFINNRNNNLAHAKGGIESDVEGKIDQYFESLKKIQANFKGLNRGIGELWIKKVEEFDDMIEFFEGRFLDSLICSQDFGDILEYFIKSEKLTFDQWNQSIDIGLVYSYEKIVDVLKNVSMDNTEILKKCKSIELLKDNGELGEDFITDLLKKETDPIIIKLLKNK